MILSFAAAICAMLACCGALCAEPTKVQLDADRISYEESTGIATAEGGVRIYNNEMRLYAPYVEYDSAGSKVRAMSSTDGGVTFVTDAGRLSGERVEYDLASRRGLITMPNGRIGEFYMRGETLAVQPLAEAGRGKMSRNASSDDIEAKWAGASITTCNCAEPHYRIEAKSATFIENNMVVVSKPRIYIGETMILAYPFDVMFKLGSHGRKGSTIFPRFGYESKKGGGVGLGGGITWDTGELDADVIAWTKGIWELDANITQRITENISVFGRLPRLYDKTHGDTLWRPEWGARVDAGGWQAEVRWAERQLVTQEKRAGVDSRHVVWKQPEFNIMSPWFNDPGVGGEFRLLGSWGRYEDASFGAHAAVTTRTGLGLQTRNEFLTNSSKFRPFYNAVYWYYDYDANGSDRQQLLETVVGTRWGSERLALETAYLRRWRWGHSPMMWDEYDPRQEIYQQATLTIPTNDRDISWRVGVRAAYDIDDRRIAEMVYKLEYDQHCMLWQAVYRDDRYGTDNWLGLKLTIKAYPDRGARLSGKEVFDPFKSPNSLVPLESDKNDEALR